MGYHPELLGLLILACSVNLLPTPENGPHFHGSIMKSRLERRSEIDARSPGGGWSNSRNHSRSTVTDGEPFIFPDDDSGQERFTPKFGKKSPECAKGSTYCESVDDYPSKYLDNILPDTSLEYKVMFGNDLVNDISLVHRIDGPNENPLCNSVEQVVYPKTAKNKDDQWLYVVNQGQYRQGVRIERCQGPDEPAQSCAFTEGFPIGYKTQCRQKYIYRRLIALNEGGKPITDTFQLPSCCACTVKAEGLRSRVGGSDKSTPSNKTKTD